MLNWDDYHSEQTEVSDPTFVTQTCKMNNAENSISETVIEIPETIFRNESVNMEPTRAATGLEKLEIGAERITVDEKAMINCRADLNQLVPFKYDWAWQK